MKNGKTKTLKKTKYIIATMVQERNRKRLNLKTQMMF